METRLVYVSNSLRDYMDLATALANDPELKTQIENEPNEDFHPNFVEIKKEELDNLMELVNRKVKDYNSRSSEEKNSIKDELKKLYIKFKYEHEYRRGWRYKHPELYPSVYDMEDNIMFVLNELLYAMKE